MADASDAFRIARERFNAFVADVVGAELFGEWSQAANALYKEQFAKKENPYGEPWTPRPGDDKRQQSRYYGKVMEISRDGFELRVAAPNARRSCVPFEPRWLGRWKPRFDEILNDRTRLAFLRFRP